MTTRRSRTCKPSSTTRLLAVSTYPQGISLKECVAASVGSSLGRFHMASRRSALTGPTSRTYDKQGQRQSSAPPFAAVVVPLNTNTHVLDRAHACNTWWAACACVAVTSCCFHHNIFVLSKQPLSCHGAINDLDSTASAWCPAPTCTSTSSTSLSSRLYARSVTSTSLPPPGAAP